jgi:hypothetical protein
MREVEARRDSSGAESEPRLHYRTIRSTSFNAHSAPRPDPSERALPVLRARFLHGVHTLEQEA